MAADSRGEGKKKTTVERPEDLSGLYFKQKRMQKKSLVQEGCRGVLPNLEKRREQQSPVPAKKLMRYVRARGSTEMPDVMRRSPWFSGRKKKKRKGEIRRLSPSETEKRKEGFRAMAQGV